MAERDDDDAVTPPDTTRALPLLPLRDIIVFPHMVVPLFVGREKSINALEQAMSGDRDRFLDAGFDGYLSKPVDVAELLQVVREHCSRE